MSLILHPSTDKQVTSYLHNPPHALLITGSYGVGASTLAQHMATNLSRNIITVLPEKDETVDLEKGIISVVLVRKLYEQTRTKIDSRIIIIDYAERMATVAQNAFLKLLEEPTPGSTFILVTHEPQKLLPTVKSRVQKLDMLPITKAQSEALLDDLRVSDATKRTQILYMAMGLPAEITKLAADEAYFNHNAQFVRDARDLLQATTYDKLLLAQKYKDDRRGALHLIETAMNILRQSLVVDHQPAMTKKLDLLLATYDQVAANGNIRLQLARAVL